MQMMRGGVWWQLTVYGAVAVLAACSAKASSEGEPVADAVGGEDVALNTDAGADAAKADVASDAKADATPDAAVDAKADAGKDAATDAAVADGGAKDVADTAQADATPGDTGAKDTSVTDTGAADATVDGGSKDTASSDTTSTDTSAGDTTTAPGCGTGGFVTMNGICVNPATAAVNPSGGPTTTSNTITVYITPPGNLLVNGGAETGDLTGWNADVASNWQTSGGGYGLFPPFGTQTFRTSYSSTTITQTVDLVAAGIPTAALDAQTVLHFGGFGVGWGCKDTVIPCAGGTTSSDDQFSLTGRYLDDTGTELSKWASSAASLLLGAWSVPFQDSTGYPVGTRKFALEATGDDGEGWAGFYGPSIDGLYLVYGTLEMRLANEDGAWGAWQAFAPVVNGWQLTPEKGQKTVQVQFRDGTGALLGETHGGVLVQ